MSRKLGDYTPTETTIKLLVCLLENDRFYTLSELAEKFEISKPTVSRSLERPDLTFFGKLIKAKLGREVTYRIDKSKLLSRLMRAYPKSDIKTKAISEKNYCIAKKWRGDKCILQAEKKKSFKLDIPRGASANPLVLAVLEYMEQKSRRKN